MAESYIQLPDDTSNTGKKRRAIQRVVGANTVQEEYGAISPADAAAVSSVASSATAVTIMAANAARRSIGIYNDSTQILYIKFGTAATTSDFTTKIHPDTLYEMPDPAYQGIITGIWAAANGNARVTELT